MKQATFFYLLRRGVFGGGQDPRVLAFKSRVEADGGDVVGIKCLSSKVRSFPDVDAGRILFEAFDARVVADGGTTMARTCTINTINSLL